MRNGRATSTEIVGYGSSEERCRNLSKSFVRAQKPERNTAGIDTDFSQILNTFRIYFFYETRSTTVKGTRCLVVEPMSAAPHIGEKTLCSRLSIGYKQGTACLWFTMLFASSEPDAVKAFGKLLGLSYILRSTQHWEARS